MKKIVLSCLVVTLSFAASAAETRRLSAEMLWELARLAPPVISPDGRRVVVAATTYPEGEDPENSYAPDTRLWLLSTGSDREQRPLTAEGRRMGRASRSSASATTTTPGRFTCCRWRSRVRPCG
jgi:hypothetical protein